MGERPSVYTDVEGASVPDKMFPEGYGQLVGLAMGHMFRRNIELRSLSCTNTLQIPIERKVMVAVLTDENENYYCEPYDPALHGEEMDLQIMPLEEFEQNENFLGAHESLTRVRKAGASRSAYNVEDKWRQNGGDPSFRMPKEVFHRGKLR